MDEIYNSEILELAKKVNIPKKLEVFDIESGAKSPVCGSIVKLQLKFAKDGKVNDIGYEAEACILTRAVLAILVDTIIGKSLDEAVQAGDLLQALLDEDSKVLGKDWGDWERLKIMQDAQDYTMRHDSIMLPFRAIVNIIK